MRGRALREKRALREQEREKRRALLSLRAIRAQRHAAEEKLELVAVGAVSSEAALEVRATPLAELRRELAGVGCLRARPIAELRVAGEPEPARQLGEERTQPLDGLSAVFHELKPLAGQLAVPRPEAVGCRGACAHPAEQRVPLGQRSRVRGRAWRREPATAPPPAGRDAPGAPPVPP